MTHKTARPNPNAVLQQLKDFQQQTVAYVCERLYHDGENQNRFLVADEVGLGKTLVARGVVAKAIDHLWDDVPRIDILYICSNADIARQNINRLHIPGLNHFTPTNRITLLPLRSRGQKYRNFKEEKVNFVPLTPGTSFDLRSHFGVANERVLLYKLISRVLDLPMDGAMEVFKGRAAKKNFRYRYLPDFDYYYNIDASLAEEFLAVFTGENCAALRQEVMELSQLFHLSRQEVREKHYRRNVTLIRNLREKLAEVCMHALEPDLVILDEFQRFKHLLADDNPMGELAQNLFKFDEARTLLLSATPYKMYTLHDEADVDDHYHDFLDTMDFLLHDAAASAQLRTLLTDFRASLFAYAEHTDKTAVRREIVATREALENILRRAMVRTEKLTGSGDRNGMFREVAATESYLEPQDLQAYVGLHQLAELLGHHSPLEYWKSAPYLLNFMENYQLKRAFTRLVETTDEKQRKAARLMQNVTPMMLSQEPITAYEALDPGNARLRHLLADTVDTGAWRLLWMPPSLPYYQPEPPFSDPDLENFTKRLVFSAWHVVPKAVASLVSYEVERRIANEADRELKNTPDARKKLSRLLEFARSNDRLTGMPVLAMLYPSTTLAAYGDPVRYFLGSEAEANSTLAELETAVAADLTGLLQKHQLTGSNEGLVDERWYWAAPILLDLYEDPTVTRSWWQQENLPALWTDEQVEEEGDDTSLWAAHVQLVQQILENPAPFVSQLGRQPEDLTDVLARTAVAGPGVVSLRALSRITAGTDALIDADIRLAAGMVAWAFRSLFNVPEVMLLVRGLFQSEDDSTPYWRLVLAYMAGGNIQAVLDEYAHVLRESLGLFSDKHKKNGREVAAAMSDTIKLRPASLKIDHYQFLPEQAAIEADDFRLRTHFALRFGDLQSEDDKTLTRKELVREAFNSPFWPFVLVSTSVGQEGLDFHLYCHAVMHWNLPANPVDLEQREGRVHRYKNHAIRKNLAHKLGSEVTGEDIVDIWQTLFELGSAEKEKNGNSDLVPFWIFPAEGTPKACIERHVPIMPLSKDARRLADLRGALTAYRMVFGQNRQEDLLAYLLDRLGPDEIAVLGEQLQINLQPTQPS